MWPIYLFNCLYGSLFLSTVTNSSAQGVELATLEHVLITVTLTHPHRGNLQIELVCPSGTKSIIGAKRKRDR